MRGHLRLLSSALVGAMLAGSIVLAVAEPAGAASCSAASASAWGGACVEVARDGSAVAERVAYAVGGVAVAGTVCRPAAPPGPAGYPLMVLAHAAGTPASEMDACAAHARNDGYVVIVSDYRTIADAVPSSLFCRTEVDDVVHMVDAARALSYVDDSRIVVRGDSLGGCIALRIHQQGLPGLRAVAVINAPTDLAAVWGYSDSMYRTNLCSVLGDLLTPKCGQWGNLRDGIEIITGGPPGPATQWAYASRSPLAYAAFTAASPVPLMVVQGAEDYGIPIEQTCTFARVVQSAPVPPWRFTPLRLGASPGYVVDPTPPSSCPGLGPWLTINPGLTFPDDHYLVVLDGLRHADGTVPGASDYQVARAGADRFLMLKAASPS